MRRGWIVLAGLALAVAGTRADANAQDPDDPSPASEVGLVSEMSAIRAGEPFTVAVRIRLDPGWHTYWTNAGDSGLPLELEWTLPDGFEAGPLRWPVPRLIPVAPLMTYGYEGEVYALAEVTPPSDLEAGDVVLAGRADYLVCEELCLPATEEFALTLRAAGAAVPDAAGSAAIAAARGRLPEPAGGWRTRAWTTDAGYVFEVVPPAGTVLPAPYLFVDSIDVVEHAAPQRVYRRGDAVLLVLERSTFADRDVDLLRGVLVADAASGALAWSVASDVGSEPADAAPAQALAEADAQRTGGLGTDGEAAALDAGVPASVGVGLLVALLFAFLGGVLLNLMPCVFPVLAIKVLKFVEHGGGDTGLARRHGYAFAAGVLVTFWLLAGLLLALRAGGQSLGWGFQLQSPLFVAGLALLIFTLALGMSGLFEIGAGLTRLGNIGSGGGYGDSFLTGGLAVIVATPCTAPFMGAGLGYALARPPLEGLAVFTALALGLALPYVVLASAPGLLRRLPRPGAWMETLKQFLAFPLYATVIWLVWVFGQQTGINAIAMLLFGLTLIALSGWLVQRSRTARRPVLSRVAAAAAVLVALALVVDAADTAPVSAAESQLAWEPYSADRLAALRTEDRPVFVDFTAAWCLSCQVNERVALNSTAVLDAFADANVALLKADWTSRDPTITSALRAFGRSGVPLYVVYPVDGSTPDVLPALLTPGIVVDAVRRASE